MSKKKSDKIIPGFETSFGEVFVCKKNSLKPYLEIFIQEPENVAQHNLGTLAGIFEITDESKDSSYIVNYLVSIIKKEYYSKTKRSPMESFEAALHKTNLALAKLAEHENIGWIGKINAIIFAIEKNNIHLSQTGNAKALLLRGKLLTDINEGVSDANNPNPLKTFVDVLSGRIERGDKLIITTKSLFDIFSFEEIKRSLLKFSSSEFIQFLKTALGNELEKAAVLFTEIKEKVILKETKPTSSKKTTVNAFSQAAFSKAPKDTKDSKLQNTIDPKEKKAIINEIKEQLGKENEEFIDKKTGHIYIKEDQFLKKTESVIDNFLEIIQLKISSLFSFLIKTIKTFFRKPFPLKLPKISFGKIISAFSLFSLFILKNAKSLLAKISAVFSGNKEASTLENKMAVLSKLSVMRFFPNISRIKRIFSFLDYSQKLYVALAIIALLIAPYFIIKIQDKSSKKTSINKPAELASALPLKNDKNVARIDTLNQVFYQDDILGIVNLKGRVLAVTKNQIFDVKNNNAYVIPQDFDTIQLISSMDDLNLLFLMNSQKRIISWSPVSKKFQENQISLLDNLDIRSVKTYYTYFYILDKANNQIFRYPRAEEGFGEKTNWLKDSLDLSQVTDMAVSDNIFLSENNNVIKLFRGKKEDFNLEPTDTPIQIDKIFTQRDSQNIYLLDKTNSRIIKLDLNGNIITQYFNPEISESVDFFADEEHGLIYFTNGTSIKSFSI